MYEEEVSEALTRIELFTCNSQCQTDEYGMKDNTELQDEDRSHLSSV